ncbi:unnamed protein product [Spodoptera littoralis]|uniref:Uncharacterized protein n=1 Tax=Spodoptera littoralis TaxID=7109 RepID=A0A9P0I4M5_SPOLI|nr:unnamed protein product [Spodoptera littoralis]CAH1639349.1 unnamed protein product [Spodoptera littoralis]
MLQNWFILLLAVTSVLCFPNWFETKKFKVGIEYENSLPMKGGSDRYRHRNNYDPFFVTVHAESKKGFVITYLQVTATVDFGGQVDFKVIQGQTGSRTMIFQLVSNHTDFLSYSYLTYGIREDEYKKMANIITLPRPTNKGTMLQTTGFSIVTLLSLIMCLL